MKRALAASAIGATALLGCSPEFQPIIEEELTLRATFIEWSEDRLAAGLVPVLDGVAQNLEWGSPDDPSRPYTYVQLSADNGFGAPGAAKFVAVKASYTAEWRPDVERYLLRNVYLIVQWADLTSSEFLDALVYQGPDLADLEPRVRTFYESKGLQGNALAAAVDDSLQKLFYTPEGTLLPQNWFQDGGDDRLMIFVGTGDEVGSEGRVFKNFGVPVAQGPDGAFGPLGSGLLDAWSWSASRTNRLAEAFNEEDPGGDADPAEGFAGYCEDWYIDASGPMTLDDGPVLWIPNFDPKLEEDQRIPIRAWRPQSDLNSGGTSNSKCSQINMGMEFPWLHRWAVRGARMSPSGNDSRLFNYRVYMWDTKDPDNSGLWSPGQFLTGYLLGHDFNDERDPERFAFCLPACPRTADEGQPNCADNPYDTPPHIVDALQVRAHGSYDPITRHWILEVGRPVVTRWGHTNDDGEPVHDIDFDDLLTQPRDFYVAFALWDDQPASGGAYWGSPAVKIHFDPPPPRE